MKLKYTPIQINRILLIVAVFLLIIIAFLVGRSPYVFHNNKVINQQINRQKELDTTNNIFPTISTSSASNDRDIEELKFCKDKVDSCINFIKTNCKNIVATPTPIVVDENDNVSTCTNKVQLCMKFISDNCKDAPRIGL